MSSGNDNPGCLFGLWLSLVTFDWLTGGKDRRAIQEQEKERARREQENERWQAQELFRSDYCSDIQSCVSRLDAWMRANRVQVLQHRGVYIERQLGMTVRANSVILYEGTQDDPFKRLLASYFPVASPRPPFALITQAITVMHEILEDPARYVPRKRSSD